MFCLIKDLWIGNINLNPIKIIVGANVGLHLDGIKSVFRGLLHFAGQWPALFVAHKDLQAILGTAQTCKYEPWLLLGWPMASRCTSTENCYKQVWAMPKMAFEMK